MSFRVLALGAVDEDELDPSLATDAPEHWTGNDVAAAELVVVEPSVDTELVTAVPETPVVVRATELTEPWQQAVLRNEHVHHLPPSASITDWRKELVASAGTNVRQIVPEAADAPLCVYDKEGGYRYVNPAMASFLDRERTSLLDASVWDVNADLDADRFDEYWTSFDRGEVRHHETTVSGDGTEIPVEVVTTETGAGDERFHVSTIRSLHEEYQAKSEVEGHRHKLERLHAAAVEMETMDEEAAIYDRMAVAAEEILELDQCTIGIVDDEGIVRLVAATSEMPEDGYAEPPVDSEEAGLAGRSIRNNETYLIRDLVDSEIANPMGDYRSCLSVPIGDLGVFQAVSTEIGAFNNTDQELVELLCTHVVAAIERIQSAKSLRESQRQLSTLISNLRGMAYRSTDGDDLTFVSDGATELTGYEPVALEGDSYAALIDPSHQERRRNAIDTAIDAHEPFQVEYRIKTADGGRKWVWEQGRGVFEDGDCTAVEGFVTDITEHREQRRTLEALQSTTRELMAAETEAAIARTTVDAAWSVLGHPVAAVWLTDDDGQLVPVATRTPGGSVRIHGVDPDPVVATYRDDEPHRLSTAEQRVVYGDDAAIGESLLVPLGDHGVFALGTGDTESLPETDENLATILAANTEAALDRAARERALRRREAELARQNEQLDRFASAVSHDLRNPINLLQGYVDLAREGHPGAHDKLEETVDRMERLVEEVLDLAREGRTIEDPEPTAFAPTVEAAWEGVETNSLELIVDAPEDTVVDADENRLRRLFENLFRNAREHAEGATTVRVESTQQGFAVADDGPGIPDGQRDRVLAHGYSTADDGTGFGLAIVQSIADAHGWTISVGESTSGGARFLIET